MCVGLFLNIKSVKHAELACTEWLWKFYYFADMTEHLNQLNVKMQGVGNTILSLRHLKTSYNSSLPTLKQVVYYTLKSLESLMMHAQQVTLLNIKLTGFTSNLLQPFKTCFGEFYECSRLCIIIIIKFITHLHECAVDSVDLSYIAGVSIRDFELLT